MSSSVNLLVNYFGEKNTKLVEQMRKRKRETGYSILSLIQILNPVFWLIWFKITPPANFEIKKPHLLFWKWGF